MASIQWQAINNSGLPKLTIRQVYCWIFDAENRVVIVSKNGTHWQLPGGKPKQGETLQAALEREVYEESGIRLRKIGAYPKLFGYYVVTNDPEYNNIDYIQLRYYIQINKELGKLAPGCDDDTEEVKYVKSVSTSELSKIIPWLSASGEYQELVNTRPII